MRQQTRKERLATKVPTTHPIWLVALNFRCDGNLGFLARSAACFGAGLVVIGHLPHRNLIKNSSGSTIDFLELEHFETVGEYLAWSKKGNHLRLAMELCDGAQNFHNHSFSLQAKTDIIVGNESTGIPGDLLYHCHHKLYIPMPGIGFCLNTSHCANIALYEYCKQLEFRGNNDS